MKSPEKRPTRPTQFQPESSFKTYLTMQKRRNTYYNLCKKKFTFTIFTYFIVYFFILTTRNTILDLFNSLLQTSLKCNLYFIANSKNPEIS